jgi:hypothetical protein
MNRWDRFGRARRWLNLLFFVVGAVLVLAVFVVARARQPSANAAPPPTGIGCFGTLRVMPATATPITTQTEAEASARTFASSPSAQTLGQPGALLEARAVTVIASGERSGDRDSLAGQNVWLLHFAFSPIREPQDLPVTGGQPLRWQHYAIVDAQTGVTVVNCSAPLPVATSESRPDHIS